MSQQNPELPFGIDSVRKSFHIVGQDGARRDCSAAKWSRSQVEARLPYVPCLDWYGGLCRGASSQSSAQGAWSRRSSDAGEVRATLFQGQKNDFRDAEAIAEAGAARR